MAETPSCPPAGDAMGANVDPTAGGVPPTAPPMPEELAAPSAPPLDEAPPTAVPAPAPVAAVGEDSIDDYIRFEEELGDEHEEPLAPASAAAEPFRWAPEQEQALDLAENGVSFYLCGKAGTGKTRVVDEITRRAQDKIRQGPPWATDDAKKWGVVVTAMTGAASILLRDGRTLHSWAGIGRGEGEYKDIYSRMSAHAVKRWRSAKLLIIDEVSMLSAELFDLLDYIGKRIRSNPSPLGGIQLILVGDFHQLKPVKGLFLIESRVFQTISRFASVVLRKVYRQADPILLNMLEEVRVGRVSHASSELLRSLSITGTSDPNFETKKTRLTSIRTAEGQHNSTKLAELQQSAKTFVAEDYRGENARGVNVDPRFPTRLELKVGARVMCLLNSQGLLKNGTTGTVVEFIDPPVRTPSEERVRSEYVDSHPDSEWVRIDGKVPVVEWDTLPGHPPLDLTFVKYNVEKIEDAKGETVFRRIQLPLKLAWAITIHKSQGMSMRYCEVDLDRCFTAGQAYVALSRCTDLATLRVLRYEPSAVKVDHSVVKFYEDLEIQLQRRGGWTWFRSVSGAAGPIGTPPANGPPRPQPLTAAHMVSALGAANRPQPFIPNGNEVTAGSPGRPAAVSGAGPATDDSEAIMTPTQATPVKRKLGAGATGVDDIAQQLEMEGASDSDETDAGEPRGLFPSQRGGGDRKRRRLGAGGVHEHPAHQQTLSAPGIAPALSLTPACTPLPFGALPTPPSGGDFSYGRTMGDAVGATQRPQSAGVALAALQRDNGRVEPPIVLTQRVRPLGRGFRADAEPQPLLPCSQGSSQGSAGVRQRRERKPRAPRAPRERGERGATSQVSQVPATTQGGGGGGGSSGSSGNSNITVLCNCFLPCTPRIARTQANSGRAFYSCRECKFFQWQKPEEKKPDADTAPRGWMSLTPGGEVKPKDSTDNDGFDWGFV